MGFLLERLASHPRVSMPRAALAQIERDACRRLNVPLSSPSLESLEIEVSHFGGRARDGGAVVKFTQSEENRFGYCFKDMHSGGEHHISRAASDRGLGPRFLGLFSKQYILEEYYPSHLQHSDRRRVTREELLEIRRTCNYGLLRERRSVSTLSPQEKQIWPAYLSEFFQRFILPEEGRLIHHNDERPEHIFIIGEGADVEVRLIDWGRGGLWQIKRFEDWAEKQIYWFYNLLLFGEGPLVWRDFVNDLVKQLESDPDMQQHSLAERLGIAYVQFFKYRTIALRHINMFDLFPIRFLEFHHGVSPLNLDIGPFQGFLDQTQGLQGKDLAHQFRRWSCHEGDAATDAWIEAKKSEISQ